MNANRTVCCYCYKPRPFSTGWHDCTQAQAAKKRLGDIIEAIEGIGKPRTSEPWDRDRAKRLGSMAIGIKLIGGGVKPQE